MNAACHATRTRLKRSRTMSVPIGLFSSESVSKGHPDKLANRISEAVLDGFLRLEHTYLVFAFSTRPGTSRPDSRTRPSSTASSSSCAWEATSPRPRSATTTARRSLSSGMRRDRPVRCDGIVAAPGVRGSDRRVDFARGLVRPHDPPLHPRHRGRALRRAQIVRRIRGLQPVPLRTVDAGRERASARSGNHRRRSRRSTGAARWIRGDDGDRPPPTIPGVGRCSTRSSPTGSRPGMAATCAHCGRA